MRSGMGEDRALVITGEQVGFSKIPKNQDGGTEGAWSWGMSSPGRRQTISASSPRLPMPGIG